MFAVRISYRKHFLFCPAGIPKGAAPLLKIDLFVVSLMSCTWKKPSHKELALRDGFFGTACHPTCFMRLMALTRARMDAVMMSVSMPAPQKVRPSAPVMPI